MTRVGVIGPTDPDSFADNIVDCLPDLGVEPVRLGVPRLELRSRKLNALQVYASRALPTLDDKMQMRVADRAVETGCDMVISIWGELMPAPVRRLRDAGIPTALWFPDAISNLGRQAMFVAPYTRMYFKDPEIVERVRGLLQLPVAYLPEACNPHWHTSTRIAGSNGDVVTAGNIYPTRANLLDHLFADGVPLTLYGATPPKWIGEHAWSVAHRRRSIVRQEKADIFRAAAGVLNNLHPSELTSVNCRLFEGAASGAAVLCEDRPSLHELFEPGVEVLTFSTYAELLKHARALLHDRELTESVGNAAALRAHAEHTYPMRLTRILEDCA